MPFIVPLAFGIGAELIMRSHAASEQRVAAKKAEARQQAEQQKLEAEQKKIQAQAQANDTRARQAADMQRRRAAVAAGRSSTLLTGGLGLVGPAPTQRKQLLGL